MSWNCSAAAAKSCQSCPTLCDPIDGSPPGSLVPEILQARTLEWVAISFSSAWKGKVKVKSLSCVRLFATPWTAAYQTPPSMRFSRQEYWSGVPLPSPISNLVATLLDKVGRSNKLQETYCLDTDGPSQLTHQSQYCFGILEWSQPFGSAPNSCGIWKIQRPLCRICPLTFGLMYWRM